MKATAQPVGVLRQFGNDACPAEAKLRVQVTVLEMPATTAGQCDTLLDALKNCLLQSDCVLKRGLLPSECLRDHYDELPEECRTLKATLVDCKKGMVCIFSFWKVRSAFADLARLGLYSGI